MRGRSVFGDELFSFVRLEERVPPDHPLRVSRGLADEVLAGLSGRFLSLYAHMGRSSIPPEMLLRATLLQALCPVRPERTPAMLDRCTSTWRITPGADKAYDVGRVVRP